MKRDSIRMYVAVCLALSTICHCAAQDSTFTYQGRLNNGGNGVSGQYDFRFTLFDVASFGFPVPGTAPLTNISVTVVNGLFTVPLDFGATAFTGTPRWLDIAVRTNGGIGFTALEPRQSVTATPHAFVAKSALQAQSVAWSAVGNVPLTMTANTLSSSGNVPFELLVNGVRGLRLEPTRSNATINVVGGSPGNAITPGLIAATIAGGGTPSYLGGSQLNTVGSDFGTIGGGAGNRIGTNSNSGVISGGYGHVIRDNTFDGTISGGSFHTIGTNSTGSTISGGLGNLISSNSFASTVGGGQGNVTSNSTVTVGGGYQNFAVGSSATIAGGYKNQATGQDSFIGGGSVNRAAGWRSSVSGGFTNIASGYAATVGGGELNISSNQQSVVSGGSQNIAGGISSTVAGGYQNEATGTDSTVLGGYSNIASGTGSTVAGGQDNLASADGSFAAGLGAQAVNSGTFVWAGGVGSPFASTGSNQFLIRASGGVGIGKNNPATQLDVNGTITAQGLVANATNASSPAVWANGTGTNGTALQISNGAIKVSGAGLFTSTPVFVHRATAANIVVGLPQQTLITHPQSDGNPNAILIVTHNYNPGATGPTVINNHSVGVFYDTGNQKWGIFNLDLAAMAVNAAFNVMIVKP